MSKAIFTLTFLLLATSFGSFAQTSPNSEIKNYVLKLKESLKLSEQQYSKVLTIYTNTAKKIEELRSSSEQKPSAVEDSLSELSFEIGVELLDVLTPYQWRDWMTVKDKIEAPAPINQ
jgi:hypothetical protein